MNEKENEVFLDEKYDDVSSDQPRLQHRRSKDFQVHAITGAVSIPMPQNRLELSFYIDRPEFLSEALKETESGLHPSGDMSTSLYREHMVSINLSLETAHDLYSMLKMCLEK